MMYDHEKSDLAIVAVKPTNKAGQPAAELAEPRAGAEGNASQQSTGRAQYRETVSQALKRIRHVARILRSAVYAPKVGAVCPNWARTDLCGGREVTRVPTAKVAGRGQPGAFDPTPDIPGHPLDTISLPVHVLSSSFGIAGCQSIRRNTMFRTAIVGLATAAMMDAAHAAQASRQFSCSGNMIEPTSLAQSPKSARLIVSPTNKILLDLGQGDLKGRVMSDNKIQLKFSTTK